MGPKWDEFSIWVKEGDVDSLDKIVMTYDDRWQEMGKRARQNWEQWFRPEKQFNFIVGRIEAIQRNQKVNEGLAHRAWPLTIATRRARNLSRRIQERVNSRKG